MFSCFAIKVQICLLGVGVKRLNIFSLGELFLSECEPIDFNDC